MFRTTLAAVLFAPIAALAQTTVTPTPPNGSAYSLFNPVPDSALRGFSTDRPNKSNSPITVDAGHIQYETDLFNTSYSHAGGTTQWSWTFADPTIKVGVSNSVDFELGIGGITTVRTSVKGQKDHTFTGFGDLTPRMKVNVFGNDGGDYALAVIPYVKIPTAPRTIGNGVVEGGVIAPLSITMANGFSLILQTELDALRNGANGGAHANFVNLANLSKAVTDTVTASVELYSSVTHDRGSPNLYTLDLALAWAMTPTLQLDTAVYVGLNREAPRAVFYTGLSQRF
jgi:hypothetical protein